MPDEDVLLRTVVDGTDEQRAERRERLRDALAGFDAATIATTHEFCHLVLRSLGVAGDTDAGVELQENLDELLAEVVDDLYLQRFGDERGTPALTRTEAAELAATVVANPRVRLLPESPDPGSSAAVRRAFADDVVRELERRKRRLGVVGFDDLLSRLAVALEDADAPARDRMRRRWSIVMVDEFQDTDPVQWEVIERAFAGEVTLVLIGDPKQAIYAFRGGDVVTYLRARERADALLTLDTNYRSDEPLVERVTAVLQGAALGHEDIVVRPVAAERKGMRLQGAPSPDPFRLRVVPRDRLDVRSQRTIPMPDLRPYVAADLALDVQHLLAAGATYDGRPLRASDVAVIVETHVDARAVRDALAAARVPAVYTGDTDVFSSGAAADWQCLLEAFEQPHRAGLVRAAATTMFFGHTAAELARESGEALTDRVADTLRRWADHVRARGIAAVLEAAYVAGMAERVLAWQGGERQLTDVEHLTQLLHDTAHREGLGLPALLQWLRTQREERAGAPERNRRLDSDAEAVQIMTVFVSKGLQYPVVYLPFAFNRYIRPRDTILFHDESGARCLDIGGRQQPGRCRIQELGRLEEAGNDIRLTYVALTRAQSQVVAWWAPSWDEVNGGLSRLLRGRRPGQAEVPAQLADLKNRISDVDVERGLRNWQQAGGPSVEIADHPEVPGATPVDPAPSGLRPRAFARGDRRRVAPHVVLRAGARRRGGRRRRLRARAEPARGRADRRAGRRGHRPRRRAGGRRARDRLAHGRPAGRGDLRLAGPRRARGRRPGRRPTSRPSCCATSRSSARSGRSRRRRPTWPRRSSRCTRPRSARWPAAGRWARSGSPTGCASWTSRSRWVAATWRATTRAPPSPTSAGCWRRTSARTTRCARTPSGCALPASATRACAATCPARSTSSCACRRRPGPRYLVADYKTNWLGPSRRAAHRSGVLPRPPGRGDAALGLPAAGPAVRRRRPPLPALAPARLRPGHPPGRRPLPLRARDVRARDARDRRPPGRRLLVAAAGAARHRAVRPAGRCAVTEEQLDPHDARLAASARGLVRTFNEAELLDAADVHVAQRLCALAGDDDPLVALAVACVVRGVRGGSVCVDLGALVADPTLGELPWPDVEAWYAAVEASALVTGPTPVLRVLDRLLYLDRYWREEGQVHADLVARPAAEDALDEAWLATALARVFPDEGYAEQRAAARVALTHRTSVLTGGPGTGKTTAVAGLLALLAERSETPLRIALAAPTGKAAARLQAAVEQQVARLPAGDQERLAGLQAVTLHRLLGARPDTSSRFRHHRDNRLPHDVVVVDETSMVSLTMMARLLEAVRPTSRLILVGDPFQLASVEAGAVLADLVEAQPAQEHFGVVRLETSHRFGRAIGDLAEAVRAGDADRAVALLEAGEPGIELVADADPTARVRALVVPHTLEVLRAAEAGHAEEALELLDRQRLLCAHREGPYGVRHWNTQVERWIAEETGEPIWSTWYAGRPVLVTANDYGLGVYNGDTGVAVRPTGDHGPRALRAAVASSAGHLDLATSRLSQVETMHALTIHKSQGSQAGTVVVLLPPPDSRLLTRELFYTALTRAIDRVVVVGSPDDVRAAVERRARRATGLRQRLDHPPV